MARKRSNNPALAAKTGQTSEVRIIAGEWRGRRLQFRSAKGLRPTGDRVRETLFNWLQHAVAGAQCLDLFAGSGALSFEAVSRGAARVVMVEAHYPTVRQLQSQIATFKADRMVLWQGSAFDYLQSFEHGFDIVFLDPPFADATLDRMLAVLVERHILNPGALIYVEYPQLRVPTPPAGWAFYRQHKAGEVGYGLLRKQPEKPLNA